MGEQLPRSIQKRIGIVKYPVCEFGMEEVSYICVATAGAGCSAHLSHSDSTSVTPEGPSSFVEDRVYGPVLLDGGRAPLPACTVAATNQSTPDPAPEADVEEIPMEFIIVAVIIVAFILFEYRFRKPDQVVVFEKREGVGVRTARLFPRHFSMPITKTTYSFVQTIDASAKGNLDVRVKLAVTVAAAMDHLAVLVRVGGWSADAVSRTSKELEVVLLGHLPRGV